MTNRCPNGGDDGPPRESAGSARARRPEVWAVLCRAIPNDPLGKWHSPADRYGSLGAETYVAWIGAKLRSMRLETWAFTHLHPAQVSDLAPPAYTVVFNDGFATAYAQTGSNHTTAAQNQE